MAVLTAAARKKIAPKNFALPKKDGYPIEDPAHARNALARVEQHGSAEEKATVRRAVARKYPGIAQSKGPQAKTTGGGRNSNGNGGNGVAKRAVAELGRRLEARDRR